MTHDPNEKRGVPESVPYNGYETDRDLTDDIWHCSRDDQVHIVGPYDFKAQIESGFGPDAPVFCRRASYEEAYNVGWPVPAIIMGWRPLNKDLPRAEGSFDPTHLIVYGEEPARQEFSDWIYHGGDPGVYSDYPDEAVDAWMAFVSNVRSHVFALGKELTFSFHQKEGEGQWNVEFYMRIATRDEVEVWRLESRVDTPCET